VVANAQAALTTAQGNLAGATLTAPIDGTIASLNGSVGQWMTGGATNSTSSTSSSSSTSTTTSSGFITLTNLGTAEVSAAISEADIGKVKAGQKATFTLTAYPGQTFTGTVSAIIPAGTTTSNVVTYSVLIAPDPTTVELLPGMTATVTVITEQDNNALLVPNSAIAYAKTQSGSGTAVYVLQNGTPVRVPIQAGSTDNTNTVVVSGLQPGQLVITGPASTTASSTAPAPRATSGTSSILPTTGGGGGGRGGAGVAP
jgi:macrolide-specific efflux system membrane fusion protein